MVARDAGWLARRLSIIDRDGRVSTLRNTTAEQERIIECWVDPARPRNKLILKPRQMGATTICQALAFADSYLCPDPIGVLDLTHESGACYRINQMLRTFANGLPGPLRPNLYPDNAFSIGFSGPFLGDDQHVVHRQLMAGGRGQGRSFTYQVVMATEMAFWPRGSSAASGTEVDSDVWASTLSTQHGGPHARIVVESTGNGPSGVFYDMVQRARVSDDWDFLFFPWFEIATYRREVPEGFEPTPEELQLQAIHGLDLEQIAWRRWKLVDQGYTLRRFRKEYPSTWEEPFLLDDGSWFDNEHLNLVLARLPKHRIESGGALEVYLPHEKGRRYFAGVDSSGGVGGDYAVLVILRDDMEVALVWRSNTTAPEAQGDQIAQLVSRYSDRHHTCRVLCEQNNYGDTVIKRMEKLGVRCWKDAQGKNFWTQGGRAGNSKKQIYSNARRLVDGGHAASFDLRRGPGISDPTILAELIIVREGSTGNIEAPPGKHDDHADAYVLALWCGKGHYSTEAPTSMDADKAKYARLQAHIRGSYT